MGPAGLKAVLKISSEDDHSKNAHDCMAVYELVAMPANGGATVVTNIMSSDGDWRRRLSVHLDGFTQDGKRTLGSFAEGGRFAFTTIFDYDTTTRNVKSIQLKRNPAQLGAAKCGTRFAVAGTTETGAIVVDLDTANPCRSNYRWLLDATAGELQPLPAGKRIIGLYKANAP
jgi:hypothetical protein